jgi:hypothetical protein
MGYLVFHQFGGRRSNMYSLNINHHRSHLHCGDIELKGSYMGLIVMQLAPIVAIIGACSCHMAKVPTVQVSSF